METSRMRFAVTALVAALAVAGSALAQPPAAAPAAPPPAPAKAKAKFGPNSTFKELVADPASKKLLYDQIPLIMTVFDQGLFPDTATLKEVSENESAQSAGGFTAEVYAKLVADLAKL